MIFLDTNIWIELLAVRTPVEPHEILQAQKSSNLLKSNIDKIMTCQEQLLEILYVIQKVKRKEYDKELRASGQKGINSVKEFRKYSEFKNTVKLCNSVYEDIKRLATIDFEFSYKIDDVLNNLELVDTNDYIFLKYCLDRNIKLYTFDIELFNADANKNIVVLL